MTIPDGPAPPKGIVSINRWSSGNRPGSCSIAMLLIPDVACDFQLGQQLDIARDTIDRRLRHTDALVGTDKPPPLIFELVKRSRFIPGAAIDVGDVSTLIAAF